MTQILINTEQVTNTGNQFNAKAGELEALINNARSLMNSLEAGWQGVRKTNTFNEWNSMQPNLKNAVETLQVTSRILKQAAADFEATDRNR